MGSVEFAVSVEPVRTGVAAVVVSGEIDMARTPQFTEALAGAVRRNDALALLIDLSAVTFIDSSGLNALVHAFDRAGRSSRDMVLVSADRHVIALLEMSGLERVLRRFDTRDEAVAALWG